MLAFHSQPINSKSTKSALLWPAKCKQHNKKNFVLANISAAISNNNAALVFIVIKDAPFLQHNRTY